MRASEASRDHRPLPFGNGWTTTSRYPNRIAHSSLLYRVTLVPESRRAYIASLAETQITATAQVLDAVEPVTSGLSEACRAAMALDEDIRSQADLLRAGG